MIGKEISHTKGLISSGQVQPGEVPSTLTLTIIPRPAGGYYGLFVVLRKTDLPGYLLIPDGNGV